MCMMTSHWTWESEPVNVPWRDETGYYRQKEPDQQLLYRHAGQREKVHDLPCWLWLERQRI